MIDLQGVSYAYAGLAALSRIDLRVERGESVAFVGPNGSGKSTLLKLLNGIVFAEQGRYTFDGEEISRDTLRDARFAKRFHKRIGFLFQNADAQLFSSSVHEEIAFGPLQMGLSEGEVSDRVRDCLTLLEIEHLQRRIPYHVSEGEKRKVALASVLALNPDVLTLDEPMNGLDPRTKRFLRELLQSLHAAGKTILCSTHDFAYVEGVFDRAVVLSAAHRIVRDGDYQEILADAPFLSAQNIV
jgi:cobalt/nickel transport system ATP-binding protein